MIQRHTPALLNAWNQGKFQVQLLLPGQTRPMGYCDGSPEDEAELKQIAEEEGVESLTIHKRVLKTGREIWTVVNLGASDEEPAND